MNSFSGGIPMQQVNIADEIRENPKWKGSVEDATRLLEEEVGQSAPFVNAEWSIGIVTK
jgi:hypothetical protein